MEVDAGVLGTGSTAGSGSGCMLGSKALVISACATRLLTISSNGASAGRKAWAMSTANTHSEDLQAVVGMVPTAA